MPKLNKGRRWFRILDRCSSRAVASNIIGAVLAVEGFKRGTATDDL